MFVVYDVRLVLYVSMGGFSTYPFGYVCSLFRLRSLFRSGI
jgi:hypothetical protein